MKCSVCKTDLDFNSKVGGVMFGSAFEDKMNHAPYKCRKCNTPLCYSCASTKLCPKCSGNAFDLSYNPQDYNVGSGCFIATAAYYPLSPKVQLLRDFRDTILMKSNLGRSFVSYYYILSPGIAKWISKSNLRRIITRGLLLPIICISKIFLSFRKS